METNVWQYYKSNDPGQVQVLGCDVTDGTVGQLSGFQASTGVTYPLLLNCYVNLGPTTENFVRWYGERDNFVVINKQGIVRYRAQQTWPVGNGYHLNEIRGCVDSLVTVGLGVGEDPPPALSLAASPNPCRDALEIRLELPRDEPRVRVAVHDLAGRHVAMLWDAPAAAGVRHLVWDARDDGGRRAAPGVYLIAAETGASRLTRRVVVIR